MATRMIGERAHTLRNGMPDVLYPQNLPAYFGTKLAAEMLAQTDGKLRQMHFERFRQMILWKVVVDEQGNAEVWTYTASDRIGLQERVKEANRWFGYRTQLREKSERRARRNGTARSSRSGEGLYA